MKIVQKVDETADVAASANAIATLHNTDTREARDTGIRVSDGDTVAWARIR